MVHRGQKRHVVAGALEDGHQKLEVVGGHLGREDRPALVAHLLGELGSRELSGGALALLDLGRGHHAIGFLGEAGGHELVQVVQVDARSRAAPLLGGGVGFRLGLAVGLVLQSCKQAAHANARRAQVRHLVDLQHRVHLAGRFQHLLHLIGGEGIQAASEGVQLNEIEILTLGDHLGRRVQARVVHPLIHHANGPLQLAQVRHGVLGEHGQTEAREQLGDGVVDLGILMVGAPGQHDAARAGLLHPREGFHTLRANIAFERLVLGPGRLHRRPDLVSRERGAAPVRLFRKVLGQLHHQALGQLVLVVVGHPRRHEGHIGLAQLVDVQAQRLGVTRHNGAVEVVAGGLVLLALPLRTRHPDEVRVLVEQVHDVAVRKLRRIAHALGGHRFDAGLVGLLRGRVGQHHPVPQLREKGEPERVVLVHVERARDAHGAAGRLLGRQGLVAEGALGLVLEQVRHGRLLGAGAQTLALLAAVAGDEAAVLARRRIDAEIVHCEQAGVRAALAAHGAMRRRERLDLLKGQKPTQGHLRAQIRRQRHVLGAPTRLLKAVAGQQCRAEGAHVAGDVGTDGVHFGELLEGAQHRIVQEGAALHDDLRAHIVRVANLDDLEQGVLDNGNRQTRGDVAYGGALLLGLFHAAVHEHGAAAAQIHRVLGGDGRGGELGHVQVQAAREGLDEAAAARGTGLVQHDVVDDAVLHAQALHVLAADVQDELHAGQHLLGAAQMGHRLNLAGVDPQGLQQKPLAVAGHRGVAYLHERLIRFRVAGQRLVQLGHGRLGAAQHVALVRGVGGPQKRPVLADERRLERGGAGVDAEEGHAPVVLKRRATHALGVVASVELRQLRLVGEQRRQAYHLRALHVAQALQARQHIEKLLGPRALCHTGDGAAGGHEQVRVLGHDDGLVGQFQGFVEALAQFGQVLQGAAEEGHMPPDGPAAGETGDGLSHHRLEDGGGDVLLARALVQKRLNIGLGEHAAAARDGVDGLMIGRQLVQAAGIRVQKGRHLVDEGARAAGAGAVHALLDTVVEVDDLRVLAAQLDGDVGFGDEGLHRRLRRDDLLHESDIEPLGQKQAARSGDGDGHGLVRIGRGGLAQHLHDGGAHVGVMAAVHRPQDFVVVVQHRQLHRGRSHVDADMEGARLRSGAGLGGSLGRLHRGHPRRARGACRRCQLFRRG